MNMVWVASRPSICISSDRRWCMNSPEVVFWLVTGHAAARRNAADLRVVRLTLAGGDHLPRGSYPPWGLDTTSVVRSRHSPHHAGTAGTILPDHRMGRWPGAEYRHGTACKCRRDRLKPGGPRSHWPGRPISRRAGKAGWVKAAMAYPLCPPRFETVSRGERPSKTWRRTKPASRCDP
jgi:hypothetical protein